MQEPRGHQTPPLAFRDIGDVLGAEQHQDPAVEVHCAAQTRPNAVDGRGRIQSEVDHQNDDGGEVRLWNEARQHLL
jgi:hypothetical protein